MKNFDKIMALFAAVFMFSSIMSCSSDSGSDDDNDDDKGTGNVLLDQKIEKYMSYLGEYEGVEDLGGNCFVKKLKLEEKSITIDGTKYVFDPEKNITDLEFSDLIFFVNNVKYVILPPYEEYDLRFVHYESNEMAYMKRVTSSSGGGSGEATSLNGTYSFESATGSQTNGSITLSDGTWTYNGSKTNVAAKNGTYTVDGSKVTVNWTAQADVSETFTVTDNGDGSVKWVLDGYNNSTLFSMLFGVAGQTELTFKKSE
ncbi:MAG: hypothetical protein MR932_02420 [Treponema porcinum]|nr:hypothetical protein [Treponema porcinum]